MNQNNYIILFLVSSERYTFSSLFLACKNFKFTSLNVYYSTSFHACNVNLKLSHAINENKNVYVLLDTIIKLFWYFVASIMFTIII